MSYQNPNVSAVNRRGTTAQQKAHAAKMVELEVELRRKKLSKEGYNPRTLDQYREDAKKMVMSYNKQWVRERSPEAIVDKRISLLTSTPFWNKVTVNGGFFDEVEGVLPHYWEKVTKSAEAKRFRRKSS